MTAAVVVVARQCLISREKNSKKHGLGFGFAVVEVVPGAGEVAAVLHMDSVESCDCLFGALVRAVPGVEPAAAVFVAVVPESVVVAVGSGDLAGRGIVAPILVCD